MDSLNSIQDLLNRLDITTIADSVFNLSILISFKLYTKIFKKGKRLGECRILDGTKRKSAVFSILSYVAISGLIAITQYVKGSNFIATFAAIAMIIEILQAKTNYKDILERAILYEKGLFIDQIYYEFSKCDAFFIEDNRMTIIKKNKRYTVEIENGWEDSIINRNEKREEAIEIDKIKERDKYSMYY